MIASLGGGVKPLAISLLHPSFISQIEGDVKEPILLFETIKGSFPGGVVFLSSITYHASGIRHHASFISWAVGRLQ